MKSIEISARTVTEAVELALAQLRKDRDEVAIAVLDSGESGDEALVRVTVVDDDDDSILDSPKAIDTSKAIGLARQILEEILARMNIHAYVTVVRSQVPGQHNDIEETITLHVEGADEQAMGLLIGRRGETLHSLQFMLNLLVSRHVRHWPQMIVDVGNYRQRRRESLEGLAYRMAEKVRDSGRPLTLEPMVAHERRIVHLALRSDETVYTESTGEGKNRKVVIYPSRS